MDNFITYDYLATFAGLTTSTFIVVNFLKELKFVKKIPTQYFSAIVSFVLLLITTLVSGKFDPANLPLIIINSILISCSSNGVYDISNVRKNSTSNIVEINEISETKEITNDENTK